VSHPVAPAAARTLLWRCLDRSHTASCTECVTLAPARCANRGSESAAEKQRCHSQCLI